MSGKYEVLWNAAPCGIGRDVATEADCLEAGRELGLTPGTTLFLMRLLSILSGGDATVGGVQRGVWGSSTSTITM